MFDNLSDRLQAVFKNLTGKGRLSEADVDAAMREIRMALLEADVNFKVVKEFVARVREQAVGVDVMNSLTPGQQVVKIVLDELTHLLGDTNSKLVLSGRIPNVIMLVGLQGSGKTTASAKLAFQLRKQGRSPLLVACDVYRPAAIDQLEALGRELSIPVYRGAGDDPVVIAREGVRYAIDNLRDVVIVDTAGRLHVDEEMMTEAVNIRGAVKPDQILMVVDAMTGQDAVNVAAAFAEKVDFDGVIMSKLDGDARGGAALSIRQVTGKPIKFASYGEKPDSLEAFYPDRMAKRILGMGDVVSLIEKAQEAAAGEEMDEKTAERLARAEFTLEDFLGQIKQVRKMGGIGSILNSLPGMGKLKDLEGQVDEKELDRIEAIIFAMTPAERRNPKVLNGSRRERIARGSGVHVSDVNRLLKQFADARKMMKQMQSMTGKGRKRMKMPGFPGMG
ncbi:MAG TPA: signal recognition particle protein [Coriobacteriia bacterium]|nr:signal recognition particle protein [Coriobacteriia bacterium]